MFSIQNKINKADSLNNLDSPDSPDNPDNTNSLLNSTNKSKTPYTTMTISAINLVKKYCIPYNLHSPKNYITKPVRVNLIFCYLHYTSYTAYMYIIYVQPICTTYMFNIYRHVYNVMSYQFTIFGKKFLVTKFNIFIADKVSVYFPKHDVFTNIPFILVKGAIEHIKKYTVNASKQNPGKMSTVCYQ